MAGKKQEPSLLRQTGDTINLAANAATGGLINELVGWAKGATPEQIEAYRQQTIDNTGVAGSIARAAGGAYGLARGITLGRGAVNLARSAAQAPAIARAIAPMLGMTARTAAPVSKRALAAKAAMIGSVPIGAVALEAMKGDSTGAAYTAPAAAAGAPGTITAEQLDAMQTPPDSPSTVATPFLAAVREMFPGMKGISLGELSALSGAFNNMTPAAASKTDPIVGKEKIAESYHDLVMRDFNARLAQVRGNPEAELALEAEAIERLRNYTQEPAVGGFTVEKPNG